MPVKRLESSGSHLNRSITLYSKPGCHLCEEVKADLEVPRVEIPENQDHEGNVQRGKEAVGLLIAKRCCGKKEAPLGFVNRIHFVAYYQHRHVDQKEQIV